jgi:hypothetical protein
MSEEKARGWEFWLKLIGTLIALGGLFGLGTLFYEEVWRQKKLTYTVLPTYDLQNQFFTGLVVDNRGRVTLTDVQVVISDLEAPMRSDPYMPGAHEPATVVSGGKNQTEAVIELPRLSKAASLPVYILTPEQVNLEEDVTFFVSSRETPGVNASKTSSWVAVIGFIAGLGASIGTGVLGALTANSFRKLKELRGTEGQEVN